MNDGDWVVGEPQWWWKYVFPSRADFWRHAIDVLWPGPIPGDGGDEPRPDEGPRPEPWREQVLGDILEVAAMVNAASLVRDADISQRIKTEAVEKLNHAVETIQKG